MQSNATNFLGSVVAFTALREGRRKKALLGEQMSTCLRTAPGTAGKGFGLDMPVRVDWQPSLHQLTPYDDGVGV